MEAQPEESDGGHGGATVTTAVTTEDTTEGITEDTDHTSPKSSSSARLLESITEGVIHEQLEAISLPVPNLLHSFDAKLTEEASSPLLYDITLSQSGQHVIVTDCWNRCLKAFDLTLPGSPCTSVFRLKEECPLCVTTISRPERIVVTVHQRPELHVLNVHEKEGSLKTRGDDTGETEDVQIVNHVQERNDNLEERAEALETNEVVKTDEAEEIKEQNTTQESSGAEDRERKDRDPKSTVLSFHSIIPTSCNYRGISTLDAGSSGGSDERLLLTVPKEIHVVSLQGEILQVIAPTLGGLPLLEDVIYITTTPSRDLVVSDMGARRVLCLALSGRLHWLHPSLQAAEDEDEDASTGLQSRKQPGHTEGDGTFNGVQWPLGVAADVQGRVFVCDLELHSVVLLSSTGMAGRLLLTQSQTLQFPRGLSISHGCLCLTQDDCIKVFSMS